MDLHAIIGQRLGYEALRQLSFPNLLDYGKMREQSR